MRWAALQLDLRCGRAIIRRRRGLIFSIHAMLTASFTSRSTFRIRVRTTVLPLGRVEFRLAGTYLCMGCRMAMGGWGQGIGRRTGPMDASRSPITGWMRYGSRCPTGLRLRFDPELPGGGSTPASASGGLFVCSQRGCLLLVRRVDSEDLELFVSGDEDFAVGNDGDQV